MHSRELLLKIQLVSGGLNEATARFWAHPQISVVYPELLVQMHATMRATVPVMQAALAETEKLPASDPVAGGLAAYLTYLIPQETGHDEWVLEDLEECGYDRAEVLARMPPPTIAAMVGAQYYWLRHHHPIAILGYIAVMEGNTPTVEEIERTIQECGLPRRAFRTYFRHAELDIGHNDEMDRVLDALPLTERHRALIGVSAIQTVYLQTSSVEELLEQYGTESGSCVLHEAASRSAAPA